MEEAATALRAEVSKAEAAQRAEQAEKEQLSLKLEQACTIPHPSTVPCARPWCVWDRSADALGQSIPAAVCFLSLSLSLSLSLKGIS